MAASRTASRLSRLRFRPIVSHADVHRQRRVEWVRTRHLLAHELPHGRDLGVRHLEQELRQNEQVRKTYLGET